MVTLSWLVKSSNIDTAIFAWLVKGVVGSSNIEVNEEVGYARLLDSTTQILTLIPTSRPTKQDIMSFVKRANDDGISVELSRVGVTPVINLSPANQGDRAFSVSV